MEKYVTIIGAANVDIIGRSTDSLIPEDSNPGSIRLCTGGVGRNIAENLARLAVDVKLISTLGNDEFGRIISEQSEAAGIDMSQCYVRSGVSSTYLAILDNDGEMKLALSDMSALEELPLEHLDERAELISGSEIIVVDTGLPEKTIGYILERFGHRPMFLDPVSVGKAKHVKRLIGGFDTVKLNRLEAEFLSGLPVTQTDSLERAGEYFLNRGVKRVFISMGERGVFYKTACESGMERCKYIKPVNVTGAGDAFMAGIIYCTLNGYNNRMTARLAGAMSRIAIMSESTVSPDMNVNNVLKELEA